MPDTLSKPPIQPGASWRVEAGRKGAAARKTRGNQYTTGKPERVHVEDMRARIKVGILLSKLERDVEGKIELTDGQRASIKLLIDKALPTLQAVEQSMTEPAVTRSESELLEAMRQLMLSHPDLVQQILGEQAKAVAAQPTGEAVQQTKIEAA